MWLSQTIKKDIDAVVSAHSIAEAYSVLTRMPRQPKITPHEAGQMLQANVISRFQIVGLGGNEYVELIKDCEQLGIIGGNVYDAIIARIAHITKVDWLLTLNISHFQRVWPEGNDRIISPVSSTPPTQ